MEKKNVKKSNVKRKTNNTKSVTKKEEKKVIEKEEIVNDENVSSKRNLFIGLIYLACSIIWVLCGVNKAMLKETFIFDIIVSILLFVLSVIYFLSYRKNVK